MGTDDFVIEIVMKVPKPIAPCDGCDEQRQDCAGGEATCPRCGRRFEIAPMRFNVIHNRRACFVPPHRAPCGMSCVPHGISWVGENTYHMVGEDGSVYCPKC